MIKCCSYLKHKLSANVTAYTHSNMYIFRSVTEYGSCIGDAAAANSSCRLLNALRKEECGFFFGCKTVHTYCFIHRKACLSLFYWEKIAHCVVNVTLKLIRTRSPRTYIYQPLSHFIHIFGKNAHKHIHGYDVLLRLGIQHKTNSHTNIVHI